MHMKRVLVLVIILILSTTALIACGANEDCDVALQKTYGNELDPDIEYIESSVEEVFSNPNLFEKAVVMDVILDEVCYAGCYLFVKDIDSDSDELLYVSRYKGGFNVPEKTQSMKARIWGRVEADNKGEILEAHRVELLE